MVTAYVMTTVVPVRVDYSCTNQTCASICSCPEIFFSCFDTCLSLSAITLSSDFVAERTSQVKSDMFSAVVQTEASQGSENVERKWIFNQSALKMKYNCRKWHLNQLALQAGMWLGKQSFAFRTLQIYSSWCAKWSSVIQITLKIVVHQHDTQVSVKIHICA